ncbi:MAG TPA: O-methyltransferase [Candidatus Limnocylindria bacterium]|nr:O-methyltransferase [Candidatus Limnocylindria bacterium]
MRNALETITLTDLDYLDRIHPRLDRVLKRIDREGGRENIPVVGTAVGRFLRVLAAGIGAKRVLEIGTAIGYSALWSGGALPSGGEMVGIEPDHARAQRARMNWREAKIPAKLTILESPALEVLTKLRGPFDLVFIDALKEEYEAYLDASLPLLRRLGIVAVDNLLWGGRASGSRPDDRGVATRAIRRFNKRFLADARLSATIIPVGDGVGVGVKR